MKNIIAFAGSNSKNSINKQLVTYASSLLKEVDISVLDLNDFELPLYGIDLEIEKGIPENAQLFFEQLKQSNGIIISLAEHNGAYTSVFKNLFDWLSRLENKFFLNKPVLLMAASPGGRGGQSVFDMAQDRFPRHDANLVAKFQLPFFSKNFSEGKLTNEQFHNELQIQVAQFQNSL